MYTISFFRWGARACELSHDNIIPSLSLFHLRLCAPTQWKNSNEEQLQLKNIDFDAAGPYHCEVSTDTPIFTKESNVEQVHVISEFDDNMSTFAPYGSPLASI